MKIKVYRNLICYILKYPICLRKNFKRKVLPLTILNSKLVISKCDKMLETYWQKRLIFYVDPTVAVTEDEEINYSDLVMYKYWIYYVWQIEEKQISIESFQNLYINISNKMLMELLKFYWSSTLYKKKSEMYSWTILCISGSNRDQEIIEILLM